MPGSLRRPVHVLASVVVLSLALVFVEANAASAATLPITSVLVPATGLTLSGVTYADASASNATSVEFQLFGGIYGYSGLVVCTATPTLYGWPCAWDTTTVPDGTYVLVSEAFNAVGSASSSGVTVTVNNTNSPPTESDQAPLALTSTSGVSGQALTLTTSGGSGTGAISYAVTDGTASGCTISIAALTSTSAGTCIVTATKAADANYEAISSAPTLVTFSASAPAPTPTPLPVSTSPTTTSHGYWLVGSDGGIFTFGAAHFYGSTGGIRLQRPVVGITPTADDGGYWLVASDGGVFSFGDTQFYGSIPGLGIAPADSGAPRRLNAPIVGIVPTVDDHGYFMVGADGGVFSFGDAHFEGSCPGIGGCSGAAVAVMPDASGSGYWLVTNSGHVYAFGDAINYGQPALSMPVTAAVRTSDGKGYWLLYADGQVAAFGDAPNFTGPYGAVGGLDPATAIVITSDGGGVWIVSANGSVFAYGDAPNDGGMAGQHLNAAIIGGTGW
jgi:hypothetical protein